MTNDDARLLLIVADGVRPDVLQEEMDAGNVPALDRMRREGSLHTVTSSFPSVTGPAYVPFLMGQHPASVGLPGLRWFDRSRTLRRARGNARSYAGIDIWQLDRDVSRDAPTLFELARPSLSAMSMLSRGANVANVGRSLLWSLRGAIPHFRGDLDGWRDVERAATRAFFRQFERKRPRFSTIAITSPDKLAHKCGATSPRVRASLRDIDRVVTRAREIATSGGWNERLHIWIVADHGHAAVAQHDDLHTWLEERVLRTHSHPKLSHGDGDVALMVGGNAMAHLYLEPARRARVWWPSLDARWRSLHDALLQRESVDLVAVALDKSTVRVSHAERGSATIEVSHEGERMDLAMDVAMDASTDVGVSTTHRYSYNIEHGDPLGLGQSLVRLNSTDAWNACANSPYPDALVQLALLACAPTSGDLIVSAAPGWDLRARFEPVPHVSTHGALTRDQMLVPLLTDTPMAGIPRRTADLMPSALKALGLPVPGGLLGQSFF